MKWLTTTMNLLFVTVLGGLLVVFLQERLLKEPSLAGIRATAITGPWAPLDLPEGKLQDVSEQKDLIEENNALARITIENKGPRTLAKGVLRVVGESSLPDALLLSEDDKRALFIRGIDKIELPMLNPGNSATLFLRNQYGFGWPTYLNKIHIYSEYGEIPINVTTHLDKSGYGDADRDLSFIGFVKQYWWLLLPILSVFLFILSLAGDSLWVKYSKRLLMDDDFWLAERQRLEADRLAKFVPKISENATPDSIKQRFE